MVERSIDERIRVLEQKVELLEQLPVEMRALTATVTALADKVDELSTSFLEFRTEIRDAFSVVATRTELHELKAEMVAHTLALHEELVERIKWIGEERDGSSKT